MPAEKMKRGRTIKSARGTKEKPKQDDMEDYSERNLLQETRSGAMARLKNGIGRAIGKIQDEIQAIHSNSIADSVVNAAISLIPPPFGAFLQRLYDDTARSTDDKGRVVLQFVQLLQNLQKRSDEDIQRLQESVRSNQKALLANNDLLTKLVSITQQGNEKFEAEIQSLSQQGTRILQELRENRVELHEVHREIDEMKAEQDKREKRWEEILRETALGQPRPTGGGLDAKSLNADEWFALSYIMTDPEATSRGVWLYPLHQELTYRGYTDSGANLVLSSLSRKGVIQHVDVPTYDDLERKQTTAPAYRVTEMGIDFIEKNSDLISKLNETYHYTIRLYGSEESNAGFLESIRQLDFVQAQTRFINESDMALCRIAVFAYKPIDRKDIENIARMYGAKIYSFSEDN